MVKVMIVDDEYLVRESIKKTICWNELGFDVAGEASNGEDALVVAEDVMPDVAIVDINMPFINGLEFAKIARSRFPALKVIVLTGYSSFDYARTALQAGVANYLLKPVNREELIKVLSEVKSQVENESSIRSSIQHLKRMTRESDMLLKEKFIHSVLEGELQSVDVHAGEKLRGYCPEMKDASLRVFVVDIDFDRDNERLKENKPLWRFAVSNIFNEVVNNDNRYCLSNDSKGRVTLIANVQEPDSHSNEVDLMNLCETARASVEKYLRFTVTIGVGGVHRGFEKINLSYKEAVKALTSRLILGANRTIPFESLKKQKEFIGEELEIRQSVLINLRTGNGSKLEEMIGSVFQSVRDYELALEQLVFILSEFIYAAASYSNENGIDMEALLEDKRESSNPWLIIENSHSLKEVEYWVMGLYHNLIQAVKDKSKYSSNSKMIEEILKFVDANYSRSDLSLETISARIYLSPSYISNLFKKETGVSLVEYITERRMKIAKSLIDSGNSRLDVVAESVGYNDPYYFSKCFKKHFGISVSKYIKNK